MIAAKATAEAAANNMHVVLSSWVLGAVMLVAAVSEAASLQQCWTLVQHRGSIVRCQPVTVMSCDD
jgi:hypothetical protein